ncbi:MAG: RluA family pseudouridine synthase [Hungatella sp.]|nr:RluA family pseudouridine synthase [Hungatella sp.]
MLELLYEDKDVIVVKKPVGMESQAAGGFAPDMVSEIKKHIHNLYPGSEEPYVGVIHRLDKPVGGVMVYAKTKKAAAVLSEQVRSHKMRKVYKAVVCGRIVDNVENFVDYLLKDSRSNVSKIVEKGIMGAKRAELRYRVAARQEGEVPLTLVEVELSTGRHHQIRVQFAGRGLPLWGDNRYNPMFSEKGRNRESVALWAWKLGFAHPVTGKAMVFEAEPEGEIFRQFYDRQKMDKSYSEENT